MQVLLRKALTRSFVNISLYISGRSLQMAPELDAEASFLCEMGSFPEPRRGCVCVCDNELWRPMEKGIMDYVDEKCNYHSNEL